MRIKRGDIVWIVPGRRGGLIETQVKSIGPKYITTEYRDIKFHRDSLRERLDWGSISREELDKVKSILENSIKKEE